MMGVEVRKRVVTTDRLGVVYLLQPQRLNGQPIDRKNECAFCLPSRCGTRSNVRQEMLFRTQVK
jgi:hypothetical protein